MQLAPLLSLAVSMGIVAGAVWLGVGPQSNSLIALMAYSVMDVAVLAILRTLTLLLRARFPAARFPAHLSVVVFYLNQIEIFGKLIFRIATESIEELREITVQDEAFYGIALVGFIGAVIELRVWNHQNVWEGYVVVSEVPEFSKVTISKLLGIVLAERMVLLLAFSFLVVAAISQATIPHFIGQALDKVRSHEMDKVMAPLRGLVEGSLAYAIFSSLRGASFIVIGARVNIRLRERLFASIVGQEIGFFDQTKTGDLSSRMTQDVQKVSDQVQLNVNYFIRNLIATVVTVIFMLSLSWRLTCLSLISIPVVVMLAQQYGEFMKKISKDIQDKLADCNAASEESFAAIHTVRSFGAEEFEVRRFRSLLQKVYGLSMKSARMYVPYLAVCIALPYLASILIIFYGAKLAAADVIPSSALISFVLYLEMLNDSFSAMGDIYASITGALGAAEKIFFILDRKPEISMVEFPMVPIAGKSGSVTFTNVAFAYPSRPEVGVLNGISFHVKAGTVAALVGPSGNGKSTCLALLQRWYMQSAGEVLLDGIPVRRFAHAEYHQFVTCVNQEPLLFARSIRENILFGFVNPGEAVSPELEARVLACAKLANAHDFIVAMPEGYNTQVGMRGVQLSGGQKQRIAIARALVRRPKILLLDEATSALDSESERQVQTALDSMMHKHRSVNKTVSESVTVIVVAHRLSTVRNADAIYVIEGGRVVEHGTHNNLVAQQSSAYYKLVANQLSADRR